MNTDLKNVYVEFAWMIEDDDAGDVAVPRLYGHDESTA